MQTITAHQPVSLNFHDKKFQMFSWNRCVYDPRDSLEAFSNCNMNIAENLESWARKFGKQTGLLNEIPESVLPYFNYAGWAQDALQNGDIWVLDLFEGAIAVFYKKRV